MITLSLNLHGVQQAQRGIVQFENRMDNLRPLWEKLAEQRYGEEKALFDAQPWKPLTPAYAKRKRARFGDKPILVATGAFLASLTKKGAEGNVHRVSNLSAEFGTAIPYAIFHENSRPPMAEPDVDEYKTLAAEYMAQAVRQSGFH